jgi:hypothetical protein
MGFIKEAKAETARKEATRARTEGRAVFIYRFNVPATSSGFSGPVSGAAEVIEAIEGVGWQMVHFGYDGKQSSNGALLMMFRARAAARA